MCKGRKLVIVLVCMCVYVCAKWRQALCGSRDEAVGWKEECKDLADLVPKVFENKTKEKKERAAST